MVDLTRLRAVAAWNMVGLVMNDVVLRKCGGIVSRYLDGNCVLVVVCLSLHHLMSSIDVVLASRMKLREVFHRSLRAIGPVCVDVRQLDPSRSVIS